ncbi:hypothetical protein BS47DRAFT_166474 [Hydnum rufescens UP504]|uniref:HIT domain-containing protein n=1 Tax=Hydnum rufescens UP504 TaxID=1448309 RepID=A0A9P6B7X4_9AGAM|nr:hypothetical protein BS47DRAFT_166474 [Hydnum rufescens UP504]
MSKLFFSAFDVTKQAFHIGKTCFGIVNISPIVPGHVLVIPNRIVPRLRDLSPEEIADAFQTASRIGSVIEQAFEAESLTIAVQDGPAAGQTVPHVHIHVLPRKFTDFGGKNDEVYPALDRAESVLADEFDQQPTVGHKPATLKVDATAGQRIFRSAEDMEKEATWLMSLFS